MVTGKALEQRYKLCAEGSYLLNYMKGDTVTKSTVSSMEQRGLKWNLSVRNISQNFDIQYFLSDQKVDPVDWSFDQVSEWSRHKYGEVQNTQVWIYTSAPIGVTPSEIIGCVDNDLFNSSRGETV